MSRLVVGFFLCLVVAASLSAPAIACQETPLDQWCLKISVEKVRPGPRREDGVLTTSLASESRDKVSIEVTGQSGKKVLNATDYELDDGIAKFEVNLPRIAADGVPFYYVDIAASRALARDIQRRRIRLRIPNYVWHNEVEVPIFITDNVDMTLGMVMLQTYDSLRLDWKKFNLIPDLISGITENNNLYRARLSREYMLACVRLSATQRRRLIVGPNGVEPRKLSFQDINYLAYEVATCAGPFTQFLARSEPTAPEYDVEIWRALTDGGRTNPMQTLAIEDIYGRASILQLLNYTESAPLSRLPQSRVAILEYFLQSGVAEELVGTAQDYRRRLLDELHLFASGKIADMSPSEVRSVINACISKIREKSKFSCRSTNLLVAS